MMKLHQLQALVACADMGGIRAAARSLGISQAAVTRALRELEATQRLSLIVRTATGPRFTEHGATLLGHARQIIRQIEQAQNELSQMRGHGGGALSVGIAPWVLRSFIADTVGEFQSRMPDVQLDISESNTTLAQPMLRDGKFDVALSYLRYLPGADIDNQDLAFEPLLELDASVLMRVGHSHQHARSIRDFEGVDWVLSYPVGDRDVMLDHIFGRFGARVDPARIVNARSGSVVEHLVLDAGMCTWGPTLLAKLPYVRGRGLAANLVETYEPLTLGFISRRGTPMTSAAICFVDSLTKVIRRRVRKPGKDEVGVYDTLRLRP